MMKISHSKLIFKAPFNDVSFGQVSYNLAKTMYKNNIDVSIFPIGGNVNLSAYDKMDPKFLQWFKNSINNRYYSIDKNTPCLQLWHIRDSDNIPTKKSYLFTFHEILGVTNMEKAICSLHEKVIFSSEFSKQNFLSSGLDNCYSAPLGFDEDLEVKDKKYLDGVIHYGLIGKFEFRKNTNEIIKNWVSLYGNKKDYRLTCLVENPFFEKNLMSNLINNCLDGKEYFNVTFLPRLKTNSEVCDLYNSIDIDLSGLSSAEGWNLPAFNATALGKWSCVMNHTSHKDWANSSNCILVEPTSTRDPYDGIFFKSGENFNQGKIFDLDKDHLRDVLVKSSSFAKKSNPEGQKLRKEFTYDKSLEKILSIIEA